MKVMTSIDDRNETESLCYYQMVCDVNGVKLE